MRRAGLVVGAVFVTLAVGVWVLGDDDEASAPRVEQLVEPADVRRGAEPGAAAEPITPEVAPTDAAARADAAAPGPTTPAPRRLGLEVVVRYADGTPAGHALVAVTDADESLVASGVAGRDGRLAAPDVVPSGPLDVWVAGVTYDVRREHFDDVDAPLVVDLPDGAEVSGVVRVDGAAPREEVPIAVRVSGVSATRVPTPVFHALVGEMTGPDGRVRRGSPTVDGRFRVGGLPTGVEAEIEFPGLLWTVDQRSEVPVEPPAHDVLVDLVTRPLFIARFVDEDDAPLPRAQADIEAQAWSDPGREGGSVQRSVRAVADDDGRVRAFVPLGEGGPGEVRLEVVSEDGERRGRFTFDIVPGQTTDVGDVVVPLGRMVDVKVVGRNGLPIPGAVVCPIPDGLAPDEFEERRETFAGGLSVSRMTDVRGITRLGPLRPDETRVEALAMRYGTVVVPIPPAPTDEFTIELPLGAMIDVTFAGAADLGGVRLFVDADAALYADGTVSQHPVRETLGAAGSAGYQSKWEKGADGRGRVASLRAAFDAEPSVVLSDVTPDTPFTLTVEDASAAVVWGPVDVELSPGEKREITITLDGRARELTGRVIDTDGAPVASARIGIVREGSNAYDYADDEGKFSFDGLLVDSVELFVKGDDFVGQRVEVDVADSPVVIVVERGTSVEIGVVDPRGRPVDGATVRFVHPDTDEERTAGGWDAASPHRLEAVPVGVYDFVVRLAGREWTARHDTRIDYLEVVIDDVGEATVTWLGELDTERPWLELLRLDDETRTRRHVTDDERAARRVDFAALPHGRYTVRLTDGRPDLDRSREVLTAPPFDVGPEPARVTLVPSDA